MEITTTKRRHILQAALALTYRYSGRDFRLTDVAGEVVYDTIG